MQGYRNSREHVFDALHRLDLLLNVHIARQRRDPLYANFDQFRGVFISEEEIDQLTGNKPATLRGEAAADDAEVAPLFAAIDHLDQQVARKHMAGLEQGVHLALPRLAMLFELAPFDIDALLICIAPELDLKYEKLYAYLQNDVTRKRPSVDLILRLLCHSLQEKVGARARLLPEAPLMRYRLITYPPDGHNEHLGLLSRAVKIDDRILHYLLDVETIDEHLLPFTRSVTPCTSLEAVLLPPDLKEHLVRFFQMQVSSPDDSQRAGARRFLFQGPAGVGKKFTAEALCQSVGMHLLIADVPQMLRESVADLSCVPRLFREALLQSAAVYLDRAEVLLEENDRVARAKRMLFEAMAEFPGIAFVGSEQLWDAQATPTWSAQIVFPLLDYTARQRLWQTLVKTGAHRMAHDVCLGEVADRFHFTAGHIRHALAQAQQRALMRNHRAPEISADDLYHACRAQSSQKLTTLARKITPLYRWRDIILPDDRLQQLHEICTHAKYRQHVFEQWGFDRKMSLGKGLSMLFVGPSGTGKTMAAEIIADELGLDLYKIDLSSMVSKYIGETEKNLSAIFQEAEQSNAILFFDEADAIFGKRSEVKDAHDRYANIEVNYLLQKMEEYEGITILASNFPQNFDDAFSRRLRFVVSFPFPEAVQRHQMWQSMFPLDAPLGKDIDFDFLSRKLKITGGNIKNIALNAAFLAAANSGVIGMKHIIRSTKREFQKMGRLCVKADFDPYFDWVQDER
jgi:SpoVK/Ycf46/Vps4 family AAA+-type ATPase